MNDPPPASLPNMDKEVIKPASQSPAVVEKSGSSSAQGHRFAQLDWRIVRLDESQSALSLAWLPVGVSSNRRILARLS